MLDVACREPEPAWPAGADTGSQENPSGLEERTPGAIILLASFCRDCERHQEPVASYVQITRVGGIPLLYIN